jgi:predicted ATPase
MSPGLGRVAELFFAALERAPSDRAAFLDGACGGDESLRAEVERLVAADAEAGTLFDVPVGNVFGRSRGAGRRRESSRPPVSPARLASFVGREREVHAVTELLAENRILTLMGAPGIGKTRIALRVADAVRAGFEGRVRVVEVSEIADSRRLADEVNRALGVREEPGRPLADSVRAEVGRRRLLLVLDGCERLAASCAPLAEAVLHAGARAKILATSREALGVPGEAVWHVPALEVPDAARPAGEISTYASVRLFVERARAYRRDFELTGRTTPSVAAVCRRLDGIPLAIELAAARVRTLSVEQILTKLDEPFRLLAGGGPAAKARHRSMRAAIDWTYDRLSPEERHLFRRLSRLEGEFTLADAERVGGKVLEHLERLVEKSLVLVEEDAGESRYRMYGVIRAYAREKLATQAAADARLDA